MKHNIKKIEEILLKSWSLKSSSKWTKENPAKGQCGVTALVVNDIFGGKILKTIINGNWHYYNKINGQIFDFTRSQFKQDIVYNNIVSNRKEAFSDTDISQYDYLYKNVQKYLFEKYR